MLLRTNWDLSASLLEAEVAMDSELETEIIAGIWAKKGVSVLFSGIPDSGHCESPSKRYHFEGLFSNCAPHTLGVLWKNWVGAMCLGSPLCLPAHQEQLFV